MNALHDDDDDASFLAVQTGHQGSRQSFEEPSGHAIKPAIRVFLDFVSNARRCTG
jgi:hypothetical protein